MQSHQEYQRTQVSALGESLGIIHPGLMLIMPRVHSHILLLHTHNLTWWQSSCRQCRRVCLCGCRTSTLLL